MHRKRKKWVEVAKMSPQEFVSKQSFKLLKRKNTTIETRGKHKQEKRTAQGGPTLTPHTHLLCFE